MVRAILGVSLGFVVWSIIWVGGYAGLSAAMPERFPPEGPLRDVAGLLTILGVSVVCSLSAGAAAGSIARSSKAILVLAALLLLVGIAVQASVWSLMPAWYHAAFLVLIVPTTIVGGRISGVRRGGATGAK